ncbi:hypothetical protein [Alkalihalobacterium elongatum]|nr:hypothetical protein [Alkalihalobacterium elongatum]
MKKCLLQLATALTVLVSLTGFSHTDVEQSYHPIKIQEDLPHRH